MNFKEAMEKLKTGSKVTRKKYEKDYYYVIEKDILVSYCPILGFFPYGADIMTSTGWMVDNDKNEYEFCEIIPVLKKGLRAYLSTWKDEYIYIDGHDLVIKSMGKCERPPIFDDFVAQDWIEV